MKTRKIVMFSIIIVGILLALYSMHKSEIAFINREMDSRYYSEQDVNNLEYLLKEYNADPIKDDNRKIIYYDLLNSGRENNYQFTDGDIKEYIDDLEKQLSNHTIYDNDFYYNDVLIKKGDYHNLAIALLNSRDDELTDKCVSENIMSVQDQIEIVVILIFASLYVYFIFKYTFFNKFDKKTYIKDILKYAGALIIIFILNNAVCFAVDKYVNYLGSYRGRGFYQYWNIANVLDYGILTLLQVFIVFIISLIINGLFNLKDIKKNYKKTLKKC